jgi:two-component system, NtrC family, response regulator PilR
MGRKRILVVDDEVGMLEVCEATLHKLPETTVQVEQDSNKAAKRLESEHFDLIILDIRMPDIDGVELLRRARENDPSVAVLMMTAFPSVETAVDAMKLGAADYITKPFVPEDLLATASRLLETHQLREVARVLQRQVDRDYAFGEMIGKSPAIRSVFDTIERVAPTNVDVLILGATGTGKELVARTIHQRSDRSKNRFVPIDCGAIPDDLLESELFGHERGSFTGAHRRSMGLMEFAHKGTLFLDEIAELPLRLQVKLLRALQERCLRRVGGTEEISVDVRIVSATARDLDDEVRRERFRADLFYRINVARIELPPLRERQGDLALLVSQFVERFAHDMGKSVARTDADVLEVLARHPWPGNIRELQNVIKRSLAHCQSDTLSVDDLPDEIVVGRGIEAPDAKGGFFDARQHRVATFEREYFTSLLTHCAGDVSKAAREAQIPRGTLYRLLKKYELNPDAFRD